jgi:tetratricopeptide (TPR) repeat protein
VVVPGPPAYFGDPPVVKARGGLVPAGDGDGLPSRPAPHTDDPTLTFDALFQLGATRQAKEENDSAIELFHRAAATARQMGDLPRTLSAVHQLGQVLSSVGRLEEAVPFTVEAVALAERLNDRRMLSAALVHHGTLLRHLGRLEEAEAALSRALAALGEAA